MEYKLVCFDLDGTLIDNLTFSWQLFHDYFKTDKEKREQTKQRFIRKEITYSEWANHDLNMWLKKGANKEEFWKAMKESGTSLMQGAMETINALKEKGLKLAIISGSINIMLEFFVPDYNDLFDDIFISNFHFDKDGNLNKFEVTEFDMEGKALALKEIAERENLSLGECVFIGDYKNDLAIAKEAGLSIAFNSKSEELNKIADVVIKKKDLREILKHILN